MIALTLIGVGAGDPDLLTLAAVRAMRAADVILVPRKGADKSDLADLRLRICAAHLDDLSRVAAFDMPRRRAEGDYLAAVDDWHDAIAVAWLQALTSRLPQGGKAAVLVWGDPSLYDSSLRIAARLGRALDGGGLSVRVEPGITSLQLLTAAHAIPLNALGAPVAITTGRRLREGGWPAGADRVAVMLDAGGAFQAVDAAGAFIWWGAYLGMAHQTLIAGPLAQVGPAIVETRARLRAQHGWIMDIYLLDRPAGGVAQP